MTDSENHQEAPSNPTVESGATTLEQIMGQRYSRRRFVKSALAAAVASGAGSLAGCQEQGAGGSSPGGESSAVSRFDFTEIEHGIDEFHHIAPDHEADVLIRWGDPLFADSPRFDPRNQSAAAQERQFGCNNDYIGFLQLEPGAAGEARALLCINHETAYIARMDPELEWGVPFIFTAEQCEIEKAAIGNSIVEVVRQDGRWSVVSDSAYNRRITTRSTPVLVSGPAAGHARLKTSKDPDGRNIIGTLGNCAGGMTPWGTYLTCEENFPDYFGGNLAAEHPEAENHRRYGLPTNLKQWGRFDSRFDIGAEPHEPNRFGWVVEIDPLNPASTPKKRTALGRFKHEGAESVIGPDGRIVVYMGDDERFDYLYKFVTAGRYDPAGKEANRDLLDDGVLYVARFGTDGWVDWLPLVFGQGPLTAANGFNSQAEVLIEARRAADVLGATPMDRPEDVQPIAATGKVYVMLSNNTTRAADAADAANPRGPNAFGHIIELIEPEGNFAALRTRWEILVRGGNPAESAHQASWNPATTANGWLASPDNGAVDPQGRLWVSSDQGEKILLSGTCDGLWGVETEGPLRGMGKMFFRCPVGAELTGPQFSDDGETLFVAVQHPGVPAEYVASKPGSSGADMHWPDFDKNMPSRSAVVQIRRKGGGRVG